MSGSRHRRRRDDDEHDGSNERWLITYGDMLTLLMVLFIVLFAVSQVDMKKFDAVKQGLAKSFGNSQVLNGSNGILEGSRQQAAVPNDGLNTEMPIKNEDAVTTPTPPPDPFAAIEQQISAALAARHMAGAVQFDEQQRGLVINIVTDKVLFDTGSADLRPEGASVLDAVLPAVAKVSNQLSIEGHTDNVPITGGRYPSNWELSAERATTVLRYLLSHGIQPTRVSAAGYADTRPLVPNDSDAHRARNRRVAIVVLTSAAGAATDTQSNGQGH